MRAPAMPSAAPTRLLFGALAGFIRTSFWKLRAWSGSLLL